MSKFPVVEDTVSYGAAWSAGINNQ